MDELPDNIIDFTTLKIKYDREKICQCEEPTYLIDYQNRLVTCSQCGAYADPFDALVCLAEKPERYRREMKSLLTQWKYILDHKPNMVVFKKLEECYRKGKHGRMLPCCPQCGELFRFEDINGWGNEAFWKKK